YSSDRMAAAPRSSLLAVRSTRTTGVSPPMEMTFDCGFTHGDGFGSRRHLWRYSSDRMAAAPRLSLLAVRSTRTTGVSPPMEMTFDCGFTHGDGFGFRRHPWRYSSDRTAAAPRLSLLAVRSTRTTGVSPPMEMTFDCGFTPGVALRFSCHLRRSPYDYTAAPPLVLPLSVRSTRTTGVSPPMEMTSDCGFTHGDGFGFRRHLWRYSSDRMAAAPRLSLLAVRSTRARESVPQGEMKVDRGLSRGDGLGLRRARRGYASARTDAPPRVP